ncbi:hypothetical protein, partial [Pseudomonas sp. SIMBA_021]
SKWPDVPYCTEAALTLIPRIATDPSVVRSFNQQEAVQTLNALRAWAKDPGCIQAARALAGVLVPSKNDQGPLARGLT